MVGWADVNPQYTLLITDYSISLPGEGVEERERGRERERDREIERERIS